MTIKTNDMSFPQVPQVPHKSLILLDRHCWAAGSAGCSQVIDFIGPQVLHPLSLLLRNRLRPAIGAGAQPSKTMGGHPHRQTISGNSISRELVGTGSGPAVKSDRLNERDENRRSEVTLTVTIAVQAKHRRAGPVSHNPFRQGTYR